jgi:hypothetical protein
MGKTNIMYTSTTTANTCTIAWAIWGDKQCPIIEKYCIENNNTIRNDRGNLLALQSSLVSIISSYKMVNAKPAPNTLTLWTTNPRNEKTLNIIKYCEPSIYEMAVDNGDIISDIKLNLENFKGYSVLKARTHRIDKSVQMHQIIQSLKCKPDDDIPLGIISINPTIELFIDNQPIHTNIQEAIRRAATKKEYKKYLLAKYGWTAMQYNMIDWEALTTATSNFKANKEQFVSKLIHGWLPTWAHPGFTSEDSPTTICPLCNEAEETNMHFRTCKWHRMEQTKLLHEKLAKKNCNTLIQKTLYNTIRAVLNQQIISLPNQYHRIQMEQASIGWDQMLLGRYSNKWLEEYQNERKKKDGKR